MLKEFMGDLHIHTCLSPCAENDMTPSKILGRAISKGLSFIGITDHNSAENAAAVKEKGKEYVLKVFGGMEITSREEVHILALFDDDSSLMQLQEIIYESLPDGENDEEFFGQQIIIDRNDRPAGKSRRLLVNATTLNVEKIVETVHELGGLAIASHVDKEAFSIIAQLGFIPAGLALDALELSPLFKLRENRLSLPENFAYVSFSDAHRLEEIASAATSFFLENITLNEIRKALLHKNGRYFTAHFGYS